MNSRSNTSVVGGYYGESGSPSFIIAPLLFTFITLIYSLKGGLRGSVITDIVQAIIFVIGIDLCYICATKILSNTAYVYWRVEPVVAYVDMLLVVFADF